jgi:formylglycine-generating enzyme required for sulfatase activity
VGGAEGVGVTFLKETFSSARANPDHRRHQGAARAVLKALLPESGSDIKGSLRSRGDLLEASGYAGRPRDFAELIHILDHEARLITPTDPEGKEPAADAASPPREGERYYQLTHDYLVPSLRDWITLKRKETWRGRAELCLEERTAQWRNSGQRRFLPSARESLAIGLGVPRRKRNAEQQAILRAACWFHAWRWGGALAVLLLLVLIAHQYLSSVRKQRLEDQIQSLLDTAPEGVPFAIDKLRSDEALAGTLLQAHWQRATDFHHQLRAAFALSALGAGDPEFLTGALARAPAAECKNIVQALQSSSDVALGELRAQAGDQQTPGPIRVRYAIVLLHLGDTGAARRMLTLAPDPTDRTTFIHGFKLWHGDLRSLADLLEPSKEDSFLSGLCAALGQIEPDNLGDHEKEALHHALSVVYTEAPGPGAHSAAGWALRQWQLPLPAVPATAGRHWFVNAFGMNLLQMQAGTFVMGDPQEQDSRPHPVTLTRPFFIGDRQVSVSQFRQFMEDPAYAASQKPPGWTGPKPDISPAPDCPVQMVNWYDVLLFCNWLSRKEGREPCYEPTGKKEKIKVIGQPEEAEHEVWAWHPDKNGYRLPTEAEWEYACRAGTITRFSFGNDASLLPSYSVFRALRTAAGGSRLPNAWGLFDMHGNILEWCWDHYGPYPEGPVIDPRGPAQGSTRLQRGSAYFKSEDECSSASRSPALFPLARMSMSGFRVACPGPPR